MKTQRSFRRTVQGLGLSLLTVISFAGFTLLAETKPAEVLPTGIDKFVVKTHSPQNADVPFYVRIPAGYTPASNSEDKRVFRVLIICHYLGGDGLSMIAGAKKETIKPLLQLADERHWFVIAPTFHLEGNDTHNESISYYYPKAWSGKAVKDGLELIAKKYPIDSDHLFLQGFSGGAQFVHRFAIEESAKVTAVAVNSCSWFDAPDANSCQVAWLITIGDAEDGYENCRAFVEQLQTAGVFPLFRSYMAMLHNDDNPDITPLDAEFMKYYDDLTRDKLTTKHPFFAAKPQPPIAGSRMPFIGDDQKWKYFNSNDDHVGAIPEDERIYIPSEAVAKIWGKPQESNK